MEIDSTKWKSQATVNITKYVHRGGECKGDQFQLIGGSEFLNTIGIAMGLPTSNPDSWTKSEKERAMRGELVFYEGTALKAINVVANQIRSYCEVDDKNFITVLPIEVYYDDLRVMASDMCRQHLKKISEYLVIFNTVPKEVDGKRITNWIISGERLFSELCSLGVTCRWDYSLIKNLSETPEVVAKITSNKNWLQTFINVYPDIRIDLELSQPADVICETRSGIEVLLRGFVNIDRTLNQALKDLEEFGEVDELDRCLTIWRNSGHRPDFAEDKKPDAPENHWWWH